MEKRKLSEICIASSNFNFLNSLHKGNYIDLYDKKDWRVAEILEIDENSISAHYEAWTSKYDEKSIPKTSILIAPFRYHTTGYTGQKTQAYRFVDFNEILHNDFFNKMNILIENKFDEKSGFSTQEITEFIRGKLFIYSDSLISMMDSFKPTLVGVHEIFKFIEKLMEFIIVYLQIFVLNIEEYKANRQYKNLYLCDYKTAISQCFPELALILKLCFGGDKERVLNSFIVFFLNSDKCESMQIK